MFEATQKVVGGPTSSSANVLLIALVALFAVDRIAVRSATGSSRATRLGSDKWTYWTIQAGQVAGLGLAIAAPIWFPSLRIADATLPFVVAGLALMLVGIALRVWAVLTLGRFFNRAVTVRADHRIVTNAPYAYVRHPSYTAVLLAFVGFGLAQDNWLSLAAVVVIPTAAYLRRIAVEEQLLHAELGREYAAYAAERKRLLPGVY